MDVEPAFVRGVELYEQGRFWDAHEAWEHLWREVARDSGDAALLQGLIQCAAACLKVEQGKRDSAERLTARALGHLGRAIDGEADTRGLDLPAFASAFADWMATSPRDAGARPALVLAPQG